MDKTYTTIDAGTAKRIKLIMTDVDGTLLASGQHAGPEVVKVLQLLQEDGIIIGLVSGRTMKELEEMAITTGMKGPIIAENGALAKLRAGDDLLDLGYTRKPAQEAFARLQELFPGAITGREDNADRTVDIVIRPDGVSPDEIRKHIGSTQLLDSGYIMHLMQEGISKGDTLLRMVEELMPEKYENDEVMVLGDSATDLSLFEYFSNNVLILNPNLPEGQPELMRAQAAYISGKTCGEGFVEVALHIIDSRK